MKVIARLRKATPDERLADDAKIAGIPCPLTNEGGARIGTVLRAWVQDGDLMGEVEIVPPALSLEDFSGFSVAPAEVQK